MPNRIIKESIRTSKSVNAMTDFQFRLWTYLITYVDDFGRGSADPDLLKGFVFPRRKSVTEATIGKTLAELATIGSIVLYEVDGESYLYFPNWGEHQRVQTKKSKFPAPSCDLHKSTVDHGGPRKSTVSHGLNPIQSESESESESNPKESKTRVTTRFTPPSVEEVQAYCTQRGNNVDAQRFCDFYTSKGWKIGKNNMQDWRAAIRTWEQKNREYGKNQTRSGSGNPFFDMLQEELAKGDGDEQK